MDLFFVRRVEIDCVGRNGLVFSAMIDGFGFCVGGRK